MKKLKDLMAKGDFCCEYAFLYSLGLKGSDELDSVFRDLLAIKVKVTPRTIRAWNARIRCKVYLPCTTCSTVWKPETPAEKI